MTDPQRFGGRFALHADEAAQPLAVDMLKEQVKRNIKEAVARDGRQITTPLDETWALEWRDAHGELVQEPWTPGQPTGKALRAVYRVDVMTERRADEFPPPFPGMWGLGPHIPVLHDFSDTEALFNQCCMLPIHPDETAGRWDVNGRCICECHVEFP